MYQHLLVPTDGSNLSMETVVKAVAFARSIAARITFVHAQPVAYTANVADASAAEASHNAALSALSKAETEARAFGVPYRSYVRVSNRPFEVIIDAVDEFHCDLIFMSSHGLQGTRGLNLGSQTQRVLAHARVPVLVCAIESNLAVPEADAAMATIRQEHRSLAAVMHGLLHHAREARAGRLAPNASLLRMMISYIRRFPQTLHHPKEERHLFARLRERTGDPCGTLAELCQQHALEDRLIAAIESQLDACEQGTAGAIERLVAAADVYADALWTHMSIEEKIVLPSAREHLTPRDWREVADAFAVNRDPDFSGDTENDFTRLFERILQLSADEPQTVS